MANGRIGQVYKWVGLQLGYIVDALSSKSKLSLGLVYAVRWWLRVYVVNIEAGKSACYWRNEASLLGSEGLREGMIDMCQSTRI